MFGKEIKNKLKTFIGTRQENLPLETFYFGIDPSASRLHVGHMVLVHLSKLIQRETGAKLILLVGNATVQVGDPSDKSEERKEHHEYSSETLSIIGPILQNLGINNMVVFNHSWLKDVNYLEFLLKHASHFSMNQLVEVESYRKRLDEKKHLSLKEFLYFTLQALDFLYLNEQYKCDFQLGGSDQAHNIIAGVTLCKRINGNENCFGGCTKLLENRGQKISKTEHPFMQISKLEDCYRDKHYFELYHSLLSLNDADAVQWADMFNDSVDPLPMEGTIFALKEKLARKLVFMAYGNVANGEIDKFRDGRFADILHSVKASTGSRLSQLLLETVPFFESKNEFHNALATGDLKVSQQNSPLESVDNDIKFEGRDRVVVMFGKKMQVFDVC